MKIRITLLLLLLALAAAPLPAQLSPPPDGLGLDPPAVDEEDELPENAPGTEWEPLDLRRATLEQLLLLPGIDRNDALAILDLLHHHRDAGFESLAEIEGLSAENLVVLRTYCRLAPVAARPARRPRVSFRTRLRHELQRRRGYDEQIYRLLDSSAADGTDTIPVGTRYLGTPAAITSSIDYTDEYIALHLLVAKDPGETFSHIDTPSYRYSQFEREAPAIVEAGSRLGIFLGAGLRWSIGRLTIAAGDYSAGAASGLILCSRAEQRPSAIARPAERSLDLDRSAGELSYLRGVAVAYDSDRLHALLFYSHRRRDARIDSVVDHTGTTYVARSLRDGTARRTHGDIRSSGTLGERLAGARLRWSGIERHAGITAYRVAYSHPLRPQHIELWRGDAGFVCSIDAGMTIGALELRSEVARAASGHIGIAADGSARIGTTLLDFSLRNVPAGFSVPHGGSMDPFDPGDGLETTLALRLAPLDALEIDLALAVRSPFGWSSIQGNGRGRQTTDIALRYSTPEGLALSLQMRRGAGSALVSSTRELREHYTLERQSDLSAGLDGAFSPASSPIRLRSGLLFRTSGSSESEAGRIVFAEIAGQLLRDLSITGRYTLFDGDTPVYQYEQLLPAWPRSVALSGRGIRYWIKMTAVPMPGIRLAAFVARTIYTDRKVIAGGTTEQIDGESAGMAGVQMDLVLEL